VALATLARDLHADTGQLQVFRRATFAAPMAVMVLMLFALGALAASLANAGLVKALGPKLVMAAGMIALAAGLVLLATLPAPRASRYGHRSPT
jgi:protein-S-isoprenylcysteine O-methyltransferase Ste14